MSPFLKSVSILASGTVIAQLISLLASPVVTRLYTPADLGVLAVFVALVATLAPVVCGRYEMALVLPKEESEGRQLLGISLLVALTVSFAFMAATALFHDTVTSLLNVSMSSYWLLLAPLALLLTGISTALTWYSNRVEQYEAIAKSRLVQATIVAAISIGLGWAGLAYQGLLFAYVAGWVTIAAYFVYRYRRVFTAEVFTWTRQKAMLLRRYGEFPVYNASTSLLNGLALALPVFFLSRYHSGEVVGLYALTTRVIGVPLSLLSSSVSHVHFRQVATLVNQRNRVTPYLAKVTLALLGSAAIPATVVALVAPGLFELLFGEPWREAGIYAQILMPALVIQFVVSTVSGTLGATLNNRLGAMWKIAALVVTATVLAWFAPRVGIIELLVILAVMETALYLVFYIAIWTAAANPRSH